MTHIHDKELKAELATIPPIKKAEYAITDAIAGRIDYVMKQKGISKKKLAELTNKRPSEITKWLAGGHNFTCRTIALISNAIGEKIIDIV